MIAEINKKLLVVLGGENADIVFGYLELVEDEYEDIYALTVGRQTDCSVWLGDENIIVGRVEVNQKRFDELVDEYGIG